MIDMYQENLSVLNEEKDSSAEDVFLTGWLDGAHYKTEQFIKDLKRLQKFISQGSKL